MEQSTTKTIYSLLLMSAILWGGQPTVLKGLIQEMPPILIPVYRYIIISGILFGMLFVMNRKITIPTKRQASILAAMALSGITLNNIFQFTGLQYSTAINCSLVSSTTPALTSVLAAVFLKERMSGIQWLGIMISFGGVFFLVTRGSVEILMTLSFNDGDILFFTSQIGWAIYTILSLKIMFELSPMATTAWSGLAGAFMTGIYALWCGIDMTPPISPGGAAALLYMSIGGGVLAMTWWNKGVKVVGPSKASLFFNVVPIAGMIFGVLFVGESLGWSEILAALMILTGIYLSTQGYKRFQETRESDATKTSAVVEPKRI